jgi:hypothetical protein
MTRTATLAQPLIQPANNPGDPVYIIVADDAPGPWPRIGDVTRRSASRWEAWPMGSDQRVEFATRRAAVEFIVASARVAS